MQTFVGRVDKNAAPVQFLPSLLQLLNFQCNNATIAECGSLVDGLSVFSTWAGEAG